MNIRHLRNFVVLAETLHFGQAARQLHISQPPLSRQIGALEQALGIQLFVRNSRSVSLTPAGEDFYRSMRRLLNDFDQAIHSAQATFRGESGALRIGFTMYTAWSILPQLLEAFTHQFPDVRLSLSETLPGALQQALHSGEVDLGISFPVHQQSDPVQYRHLFREPLCAVLPETHPQAREGLVRAAALAEEKFITFPAATAPELHTAVMACCHHAQFEPQVCLETHLQQTIVNLVARGLGVSLVPDSMRRMQLEGAVFRPLADSPQIEQGIYWNSRNPNPCLTRFLQCTDRLQATAGPPWTAPASDHVN